MAAKRALTAAWLLLFGLVITSEADTLLIADKTGHKLLYLDTGTGKVTRSVAVGENPHEVAVTRDGRLAFVANPGATRSPSSTSPAARSGSACARTCSGSRTAWRCIRTARPCISRVSRSGC